MAKNLIMYYSRKGENYVNGGATASYYYGPLNPNAESGVPEGRQ